MSYCFFILLTYKFKASIVRLYKNIMRRAYFFYILKSILIFTAYFAAAQFGLAFGNPVGGFASLVWPPSGIALAVILLWGFRYWPAIFIGAFANSLYIGSTVPVALGIGLGNALEAVLAGYFIRRKEFHTSLNRLQDILKFITFTSIATAIGAFIGSTSLLLSGIISDSAYNLAWRTWWLGDVLGVLVVTPLLLTWLTVPSFKKPFSTRKKIELFALASVIVIFSLIISLDIFDEVAIFLGIYTLLLWATLGFGQRGSSLSLFILFILYSTGTVLDPQFFNEIGLGKDFFQLQIFITVTSIIMMALAADFLERKSTEEKLRSANKFKDEFLTTLAHELRNPLSPILSSLDLIEASDLKDASLKQPLGTIGRQIRYMARLIDDLLDISRVSRGKILLRKEVTDIKEVINHAVETVTPLIQKKQHNLHITLPVRPVSLETDPLRIEQVLVNLLNNAAMYTHVGGHIWLSCMRKNDEIAIKVRDSGAGIAPDALAGLFENSGTVLHSLGYRQGGLGIGLKLIKILVELHSGRIKVYSEGLNKGAEFTVYLPARRESDRLAQSRLINDSNKSDSVPNLETQFEDKVLVVDDNKDAADSLGRLLEKLGKNVKVAYDGPAALEIARDYNPEIIFLDIGLPGMDGYEVARQLRKENNKSILIAVTGYGQEDDKRRSLEAGFNRHLVKPIGIAELKSVIS